MDIESPIQVSLPLKPSKGALSMEHHSKICRSIGSVYTNGDVLQSYPLNRDGCFLEDAKLTTGGISETQNLSKETMRSHSGGDSRNSKDQVSRFPLNDLLESSDEFYPRYWGQPPPSSTNTISIRNSPSCGSSNGPKEGNVCLVDDFEVCREAGHGVVAATAPPPHSVEETPSLCNSEVKPTSRSTHACIVRRPFRERCEMARQIAMRWVSRLVQELPTEAGIKSHQKGKETGGACVDGRNTSTAPLAKSTTHSSDCVHSDPVQSTLSSDLSRTSNASRVFNKATDSKETSVFNSGCRRQRACLGNERNGGNSSDSFRADVMPAHGKNIEPAQVGASSFSYDRLELVPDDNNNIVPLLRALHEIVLSCASLELPEKNNNNNTNSRAEGKSGSLERQGCGKSGPRRRSAPRSPAMSSCSTESDAQAHLDVYEKQWNMVRNEFNTIRRLILNDGEFAKVLDSIFGVDWRTVPSSSATTSNRPATREEQSKKEIGSRISYVEAVRGHSKQNTTETDPDKPSSTSQMFEIVAAKDAHDETDGDVSGILETQSPLNHNAVSFHSRHYFALSGSSTDYSPSRHVASFLTELPTSPGTALYGAGVDLKAHPTVPHESDSLKSASFPAVSLDEESEKYGLQRSAKPLKRAAATSNTNAPVHTPTLVGKTNPSTASVAAASTSLSSSPPITFCLESREDMMRRRIAAPHAFFAAASPPHRGGSAYFTTPTLVSSSLPTGLAEPATAAPSPHQSLSGGGGGGVGVGVGSPLGKQPFTPRSLPISPLLAFNSPALLPQCPYDYLLVLDFEATCEEHVPPGYLYEIVEFPVVLVDTKLQRAMAEFHRFVRPRHKPTLSAFCRSLTGIRQEDVDAAAPLEEVVAQFERWYRQTIPPNARAIFATDGPADFREFMYNHSVARQGIRFPSMFYQWIDIKKSFAAFFNCQQGKIKAMLDALHMPFNGKLHNGMDDARNLANIVIGLLQRGCTFCEVPLSRLLPNTPSTRSYGGADILNGSLFLPPAAVSIPTPSSNSSFAHMTPETQRCIDDDDTSNKN